jgi:hypothetical protein
MRDCSDGDACTTDRCDAATGDCTHEPLTDTACDDHDPCTGPDRCQGGACVGVNICAPNEECTAEGTCRPAVASGCVNQPDGATCSDGDACTEKDECQAEHCIGGTRRRCDDGNPCTIDGCTPQVGCTTEAAPDGLGCDDGDECTNGAACQGGSCGAAECTVVARQVEEADGTTAIEVDCAALAIVTKGSCQARALLAPQDPATAPLALGLRRRRIPTAAELVGRPITNSVKRPLGRRNSGRVVLRLQLTQRGQQLLSQAAGGSLRVEVRAKIRRAGSRVRVTRFLNLLRR